MIEDDCYVLLIVATVTIIIRTFTEFKSPSE